MRRSLTSELPDHAFGDGHGGASRASSRIPATCAGTFPAIPLLPVPSDDSLAAIASDSRSTRASRRIARVDLSLRSGTARQAAHFCPLLQASPAAHLRCPWQTTLHPGRELPRYTPRPRGLKMLDPMSARSLRFAVPSNEKTTAGAAYGISLVAKQNPNRR